jgi:transcriptional regulator with XRE-family HTH domain
MPFYIFLMKTNRGPQRGTKYHSAHLYSFGQALAAARRKKGYTQEELGKLVGTSKRVISYFEREAKNPTIETINKLADVLGVLPERLLKPTDALLEEPKAIRSLQKKLNIVHKLPPDEQRYIAKMIDIIAEKNGVQE